MKKSKFYEIIGFLVEQNELEIVQAFQIAHLTPIQRLKKEKQKNAANIKRTYKRKKEI